MDKELVVKLSEQLGVTIEHLWGTLLVQAKLEAFVLSIFIIAFITTCIAIYYYIKNITFKEDDGAREAIFCVYYIFLFVMGMAILSSLGNIITIFINPEYWALKQIIK